MNPVGDKQQSRRNCASLLGQSSDRFVCLKSSDVPKYSSYSSKKNMQAEDKLKLANIATSETKDSHDFSSTEFSAQKDRTQSRARMDNHVRLSRGHFNLWNFKRNRPNTISSEISSQSDTRSQRTRNLPIVRGWGMGPCTITCIAMAANVDYKTARDEAARLVGFHDQTGLHFSDAVPVLCSLGVKATLVSQVRTWDQIPKLAIVAIKFDRDVYHAIVFQRTRNGPFIYDSHNKKPVPPSTRYELSTEYPNMIMIS